MFQRYFAIPNTRVRHISQEVGWKGKKTPVTNECAKGITHIKRRDLAENEIQILNHKHAQSEASAEISKKQGNAVSLTTH